MRQRLSPAMEERLPLFAGLALLAIAVLLGSVFIGDGIRDRNQNDVITVTGSAKQRITSDYVVWRVSLTSDQLSPGEAAEELAGWTRRTRRFFSEQGVENDELTVHPVSAVGPGGFDEEGNEVTGFRLTREFEIRSARVDDIAALAEESATLLAENVPVTASPPEYVYTKLSSLRPRLLTRAIRDAQRRADVISEASGVDLGDVRRVNVGVFQITAPNSTEVSDYGEYDTSTLRKEVTAVVNVTFALDG